MSSKRKDYHLLDNRSRDAYFSCWTQVRSCPSVCNPSVNCHYYWSKCLHVYIQRHRDSSGFLSRSSINDASLMLLPFRPSVPYYVYMCTSQWLSSRHGQQLVQVRKLTIHIGASYWSALQCCWPTILITISLNVLCTYERARLMHVGERLN